MGKIRKYSTLGVLGAGLVGLLGNGCGTMSLTLSDLANGTVFREPARMIQPPDGVVLFYNEGKHYIWNYDIGAYQLAKPSNK